MNSKDVIVRIVLPAEAPKQAPKPLVTAALVAVENEILDVVHKVMKGLGLAAMLALAVFLAVGLFGLGFALKEVCVMLGVPLAIGLAVAYVTV